MTGAVSAFPGVPAGTRAAELPDSEVELPSGFLSTFGRPPRESACECERSSGLQLGPVMALVSGPTISDAIGDPKNEVARLVKTQADDRKLVDELFYRVLNRPPTESEIGSCVKSFAEIDADHLRLAELLGQRETEFALKRPQLERQREAELAAATAALASYEAELAPKLAAREKEKAAQVGRAREGPEGVRGHPCGQGRRVGEEAVDRRPLGSHSNPRSCSAIGGRQADGQCRTARSSRPGRTRTAPTRSSPRPT